MSDQTAPAPPPLFSTGYQRYAIITLVLVYSLNFLDRQIMNTLAEPIRNELHLDDGQLGMMTGLAFALFYTFLGIPLARLAERANRPFIISAAIATWSGFTVLCGYAQNFTQMILARIGVGVGEAGCTPPAHSLISDYVPPEKRASALALYSVGIPLGSLLGTAVGGIAANFWGWRVAFIIAGAPGIIIALIVFLTLKEPRRHHAAATHSPGIGEAFKAIAGKPTFALIALGAAMMSFAGYASSAFSNSYYLRNFDAQLTELGAVFGLKPIGFLGLVFGTISGVAGIFGTMAGGWLADRIGNGNLRVRMVVPAVAALLVVPVAIAGYLMTDAVLAFVLLLIPTVLASMWYGPIYATNQGLVHPRTRATVSALLLFIINIIGLALGPTSVGYLSKMLTESYGYTPGEAIRWALIASTACFVIAAGLFWAARRTIERDTMS